MISLRNYNFASTRRELEALIQRAPVVHTERWQGRDISKAPDMRSHELVNVSLGVDLRGIEDLSHWRNDVKPHLPWADRHFEERVSGYPLNPGREWQNWPWASSADRFRSSQLFNHSYMERLWPKYAGHKGTATVEAEDFHLDGKAHWDLEGLRPRSGIRWQYGDLSDLVDLLACEPLTRQAWIPLFFPEDTGVGDGGRKPCTLGYQFIVRNDRMHVYYPLRSCDFIRHWSDDVYMAIRLLLWVLSQLRARDSGRWASVKPGFYAMHMTSLHVFTNDMVRLRSAQ